MTKQQRYALLATIIGSGAVVLDANVVTLALPHIASNLHASFSDLQWIVDGYLLSLSALILVGGSLGDIFGRKKIYLLGLIGFGSCSLLCGLAPTAHILILTRILQGIFGAMVVPGALAIINTNFSKSERGAAIGSWSAWSAIFTALGPLLGGYILGVASWRWIFLINVPLVIACYALGNYGIQESHDPTVRHVDMQGALLAMLALAGLTYGLIEGPSQHWHAQALVPLVLGACLAVGFVFFERRSSDPLVKLGLFRSRNFTGANIMTFGMYGALNGFLFALLIYLQTHWHYSSFEAGISVLPVTIFLLLFSRRVGTLSARIGTRRFITLGPLLAAAGMLSLLRLQHSGDYLTTVLPGVLLFACGMVTLVAPLTTTVMASVPETSSGIASGINNAVTRVAGLIVIATLGLLGSKQLFHFAMILCASLATIAGIAAFALIRNPTRS